MSEVEIHAIDDWTVIYVDGEAKYEDHRLDAVEALGAVGITCKNEWHESDTPLYEFIMSRGNFPETIEELKALKEGTV